MYIRNSISNICKFRRSQGSVQEIDWHINGKQQAANWIE